ncbi:MAG: YIP1 family protein [Blastocatellia bacterium]
MSATAISVGNRVAGLMDVFVDPQNTASYVQNKHAWVIPSVVIGIGGIFLGLASLPLTLQVVQHNLPTGLSGEQIQQTIDNLARFQRIGVMLTPVVFILKSLISAWILYTACVLLDIRTGYRKLFSLVTQCAMILFLQDLTVYTIIKLRGAEVRSITDLTPGLGLDLLLHGSSKPVMAVVSYFSVFNIWYIVMLSLTLSFLSGCSKKRAFVATIPNWLFGLFLCVGVAWLAT